MATLGNISAFSGWASWLWLGLLALAAITDYRQGKIYNWLTLPLIFAGLAYSGLQGWPPFVQSLLGLGLGLLLLGPLFFGGVMGGGDVKLFMAVGAWFGPAANWQLFSASIMLAAVGAIAILIARGRLKPFLQELFKFLRSAFTPGLALQWPRLDRTSKAPFGIAVFAAFLMQRFLI